MGQVQSTSTDTMPFRSQYEDSIRPEWSSYYVRYKKLRNMLRSWKATWGRLAQSSSSEETTAPEEFAEKFVRRIDRDVEVIDLFVMEIAGGIAAEIARTVNEATRIGGLFTEKRIASLRREHAPELRKLLEMLFDTGDRLIHIMDYVNWNVRALNKLIKKASKVAAHTGQLATRLSQRRPNVLNLESSMSRAATSISLSDDNATYSSLGQPPLQRQMSRMIGTSSFDEYTAALNGDLHDLQSGRTENDLTEEKEQSLQSRNEQVRAASSRLIALRAARLHFASLFQRHHLHILDDLESTLAQWFDRLIRANEKIASLTWPSPSPLPRDHATLGAVTEDAIRTNVAQSLDPNVSSVSACTSSSESTRSALESDSSDELQECFVIRRRALDILRNIAIRKSNLKGRVSYYTETLAAQAGIFASEEDKAREQLEIASYDEEERRLAVPEIDFVLNSASAFIYMVSYYCILPTAGSYAEALGSSKAASGVLIGGAPVAGILSSVFYSYLSSKGFKTPLILASSTCLAGNAVYAMAWSFRSLPMAILGRLMVGFGGARAINRRFIADCAMSSQRVQRSADFVTYSAIGMAAGPALSAAIASMPNVQFSRLSFNEATNPPWTLVLIWSLFVYLTYRYFEEPFTPNSASENCSWAGPSNSIVDLSSTILYKGPQRSQAVRDEWQPVATDVKASANSSYGSCDRAEGFSGVESSTTNAKPKSLANRASQWKVLAASRPVQLCLWLYFLTKFICELLLSSAALVLPELAGWSEAEVGTFVALLGCLMFPANYAVSRLAVHFEEYQQLQYSLVGVLAGCILLIPYLFQLPVFLYVASAIVVFICTNVAESILMAMLAGLMPASLARGTLNSGLLSTEAGMLGRAAGDIALTVAASGASNAAWLLRRAFVTPAIATAMSLIAIAASRDLLIEASSQSDSDPDEETGLQAS